MSKQSISVWKDARANVEGLPECPDGLSEPYYANLMFVNTCTVSHDSSINLCFTHDLHSFVVKQLKTYSCALTRTCEPVPHAKQKTAQSSTSSFLFVVSRFAYGFLSFVTESELAKYWPMAANPIKDDDKETDDHCGAVTEWLPTFSAVRSFGGAPLARSQSFVVLFSSLLLT